MRKRKAKKSRRVGHPVPGLTGPMLLFDLWTELAKLYRQRSWRRTGRSAKTLVKYPDFRIVLIALKRGVRMQEHKAAGRISVQTLVGRVRLQLPKAKANLPAGALLTLERNRPHDVEAVKDSVFLLTLSWPRR